MKLIFICLFLTSLFSHGQNIKVLAPSQEQEGSIDFFNHLLTRALEITENDYEPVKFEYLNFNFSQDRSLKMLIRKELDVIHTMTSRQRELDYLAVKFPLVRGLMGHRLLVIDKTKSDEFNGITEDKLAQKIACQGLHWPDSDILDANNYTLARIISFEAMYEMVSNGRCDYFPRSVLEINSELELFSKTYPNLISADNIMLLYPANMYFFVEKSNVTLAKRLQIGLERLEQSGEYRKILTTHPLTKGVFPLSKWDGMQRFHLINPNADSSTKSMLSTY